MKIRLVSDLHTEFIPVSNIVPFINTTIPAAIGDENTVLVLAGDIFCIQKQPAVVIKNILTTLSERFFKVLFVYGNHEYYYGTFPTAGALLKDIEEVIDNFHVLDNKWMVIKDPVDSAEIGFIGSTLWSSFSNGNLLEMYNCKLAINDFTGFIKTADDEGMLKSFLPEDSLAEHIKNVEFLETTMDLFDKSPVPYVVITHFLPSYQCVDKQFRGSNINGAFASDLDYLFEEYRPSYWLHGHTHSSVNKVIGSTVVLCNPLGYTRYSTHENSKFDPTLSIEL